MQISELLEIIMVLSFGMSWPLNVRKAYRARTAKGSSLGFLALIEFGYVCGIIGKLIGGSWKWYVLFFYFLNLFVVGCAIAVYFRNRRLDRAAEIGKQ